MDMKTKMLLNFDLETIRPAAEDFFRVCFSLALSSMGKHRYSSDVPVRRRYAHVSSISTFFSSYQIWSQLYT